MLKDRIMATINFFDLQNYPLTLLELHNFLITDWQDLKQRLDSVGEITKQGERAEQVDITDVLNCLNTECKGFVQNTHGFYHLPAKGHLATLRLEGYYYGLKREKTIQNYVAGLKYVPFVRGVALAGSQAMGEQKEYSDIDLFIITEPKFLWLARTLVTAYFQFLGKRRHGRYIANRFCLNHYVAGAKVIEQLKNLYTACEYAKLRPLVYENGVRSFQNNNIFWLTQFFPNLKPYLKAGEQPSKIQRILEGCLNGALGKILEQLLKSWQLPKIKRQKFIVTEEDELSFHPDSKQQKLLDDFLQVQEQQERVSVKLVV